jgi:hypothetical protein
VGEGRPVMGLIDGNQGANELEYFTESPGLSAYYISARSWVLLLTMILIVIGNLKTISRGLKTE